MMFNKYFILFAIFLIACILYFYYAYFDDSVDTIIDTTQPAQTEDLSEFCMDRILSDKQAIKIAKQIKRDQKYWKSKNILMYILGTASYIEGKKGYSYYKSEYTKTNKHLHKNYKELYDALLTYFQQRTPNSKVAYRFALPGFHIFKCNKIFSLPVASVHKDRQYLELKFNKNEDIDYDKTLSFTLSIELPPTGAGLIIYENDKKVKINYKVGHIVCHNGQTTHMIAPSPVPKSKKQCHRITLQGHGVYDKNSNTWWLYW